MMKLRNFLPAVVLSIVFGSLNYLAVADTAVTGDGRVFANPTSNGDMKLRVNVGGTNNDSVLVQGSSGHVGVGTGVTTPSSYFVDNDDLVIVGTTNVGLSLITTSNTSKVGISFGDAAGTTEGSASNRGKLWYDMSTDIFNFVGVGGLYASPTLQINSTGIKLPAFTSGTATTLNGYEEWTGTSTASSGAITTTATLRATRVGRFVAVHVPATVGSCSASNQVSFGETLPLRFRPNAETDVMVPANNAAAQLDTPGMLDVSSAGGVTFYRVASTVTQFSAGSTCGLPNNATISYYTNN